MSTVLDSGSFVSPAAIKQAGHAGSFGYLSTSRPGTSFSGKPIKKSWVDEMNKLGLTVISCWQFGKNATADWRKGFMGGVADANAALTKHKELGGDPSAPIFFAIDDDVTLATFNGPVSEYLKGAASILGVDRVGVYGSIRVVEWAVEDELIGKTHDGSGRYYGWQTKAWSQGISKHACVYQRIVDTASNPGPIVGSSRVDVNDVLTADYGQWGYSRDGVDWDAVMHQFMGTLD
ncbi:endolysin [Gordonia phage GordDuk1]|uniref:Lysin n=1 Tax=Gordonia phage GordDuk1 TaxID=1622191 RepID=A0A0E3T822_9CAUD|nr:endolysin [Gordonia phage GordDuk1]AKC02950.1 lysin [Gordonia phage GordDuk1]